MKFDFFKFPRELEVGNSARFSLWDCGRLTLSPDEQVTFETENGGELDVVRKNWGFYATPSLNDRLVGFGLRGALVRNRLNNRYYVLLVEQGKVGSFEDYLEQESCEVVHWLDTTEALDSLRQKIGGKHAE